MRTSHRLLISILHIKGKKSRTKMKEPSTNPPAFDGITIPIAGVKVRFPFKPYPSQKAMMAMIIKGLTRRQNCLLESPTGSGKSLALLCSTLGWLEAEEDRVSRFNSLIDEGISDPDILSQVYGNSSYLRDDLHRQRHPESRAAETTVNRVGPDAQNGVIASLPGRSPSTPLATATTAGETAMRSSVSRVVNEGGFIRDADDDDFRPMTMNMRVRDESGNLTMTAGEGPRSPIWNESGINLDDSIIGPDTSNVPTVLPRKLRVPIVYFGTRTHKQIYQITKELRRSGYPSVRSVVLASREHTCIHPVVSTSSNKNEDCKILREDRKTGMGGCLHHEGVQRMRDHDQLKQNGLQPAWDIEDLVKLGRKLKACPYYASRHLKDTAQIIVCPYNYLVDPLIRESMQIELKDNIVILDEAHNVEDSSRDAASLSVNIDHMVDARNDLEKLKHKEIHPLSCEHLIEMLSNLCMWMHSYSEKLTDYSEFGRTGKIIPGTEMITQLKNMDITADRLKYLQDALGTLTEDESGNEEIVPKPSSGTATLIKGLFLMFNFLFKNDCKYAQDYQIALIRTQIFGGAKASRGFFGKKKGPSSNHIYSLNFWCLNPGVVFSAMGEKARCVILTSGTLSPMDTFESELQVSFPIRLEANHVINKEQVWVGTIANGPTNHSLSATYKNSETYAFQDELGRMLVDICDSVPRGVLCFFSSYSMLQKLVDRWQVSTVWEEIQQRKVIVIEPRRSYEFEEVMRTFYETIRGTANYSEGEINGALFLAVCRGKVSEGLDFMDDNARAVITVGIPFPNVKDIQVDLKRKYNNKHGKQRGLLSGDQWYEIQAYRALNQALGRCIRHRYDWGALILVDERYQKTSWGSNAGDKYIKGLSKWVKRNLIHQPDFNYAIKGLQKFSKNMIENPPQSPQKCIDSPKLQESQKISDVKSPPKPRFPTPPKFSLESQIATLSSEKEKQSPRKDKLSAISLKTQFKLDSFRKEENTVPSARELKLKKIASLTPIKKLDSNRYSLLSGPITSTPIDTCDAIITNSIVETSQKDESFDRTLPVEQSCEFDNKRRKLVEDQRPCSPDLFGPSESLLEPPTNCKDMKISSTDLCKDNGDRLIPHTANKLSRLSFSHTKNSTGSKRKFETDDDFKCEASEDTVCSKDDSFTAIHRRVSKNSRELHKKKGIQFEDFD